MFKDLSRRKFFGFMAAAPATGKAVVEKSAKQMALEEYVRPTLDYTEYDNELFSSFPGSEDDLSWIKKQIKELTEGMLEAEATKLNKEALNQVHRIDPDLAYARSFSMGTKIRLQAQRNLAFEKEEDKKWRLEDIQKYKNRLLNLTGGEKK